ncbi:hypothetical protein AC578_1263 [Pseudocercospora eumusae]|uniref:Uncharacterized protein n=1 Tax=Pseudocercospora eumusae TaxID=321146 RepID=A0A139H8E4_9PEZI|nr:hypothetical protein AC578_1263 [Pseudocercospora eumusae]
MVQTREFTRAQPTVYWKLIEARSKGEACQLLDIKGVKYPKSISAARAKHLYLRAQRHLLVYEKCSVEELRKFCTARHIPVQTANSRSKGQSAKLLVARLEEADESMTLEKFLDLPPELRVLSLPEFYDCFHFSALVLFYHSDVPSLMGYDLASECRNFIPKAPQEVLNRLQNITLAGHLNPGCGGGIWEVVIELKTGRFKVQASEQFESYAPGPRQPSDEVQGVMERRASQFVEDRQQAGESRVTLRVNDAAAIIDLFLPTEQG